MAESVDRVKELIAATLSKIPAERFVSARIHWKRRAPERV